jgi:transposase
MRQVVDGLMFILSTGCQWQAIPKDLAARSTVNYYFRRWQWDGTLDRIHHEFYVKSRIWPNERPVRRLVSSIARASKAPKKRALIDHRLAQPLLPTGQGLGVLEPQRAGISTLGLGPPHGQKALSSNNMIHDRLRRRQTLRCSTICWR